jgi:hypothetical protein
VLYLKTLSVAGSLFDASGGELEESGEAGGQSDSQT